MGMKQPAIGDREGAGSETLPGLTARQAIALHALVMGKSHQEAAEAAKVHRNSVYYWLYHSETFQAHFIAAQRMLWGQAMRSAHGEALASIRYLANLRDNEFATHADRTKAAIALLKHAQWPSSAAAPSMPTEKQLTILCNAYDAHRFESIADLDGHLAMEHMLFRPEEKRQRIAELATAVQDVEAEVQKYSDRLRCLHGAQSAEEKREALQLRGSLDDARRRLGRAEASLAGEEAKLAQFERQIRHVMSQYEAPGD